MNRSNGNLPSYPSRRDLLPAITAGASALIVPRHVLGGRKHKAPSDTLTIAGIGVGGMGKKYLQECEHERVVALCDVDQNYAARTYQRYPKAKVYKDYRKLLDDEKDVDAVIVGTPDHWHALITIAALRAGKHVYCAKPLTHDIFEVRKVAEAAREAKAVTQISVQSVGRDVACETADVLYSGALGPIREVHMWTHHPIYPSAQVRPTDTPAVPAGLDWEFWIGPAPYRPYHPAYHPWIWRSWWDFGTGTVGDMTCHALHIFYEPLELGHPSVVYGSRGTMYGGGVRVNADGSMTLPPRIPLPETESYSAMVTWEFPARGHHPPVQVHYYDGGLKPHRPQELDRSIPLPPSGVLYVGDKGKMITLFSGGEMILLPQNRFKGFRAPAKAHRVPNHYRDWTEACKTGRKASVDFDLGSRMTEIALLGTLAARTASVLEWDPKNMRIPNHPEANALLHPPYRAGWKL
jgi:predicted dehydrogenase